jgi:RNA recognition motif-containing protein
VRAGQKAGFTAPIQRTEKPIPVSFSGGENDPNHILFVQNLPEDVDSQKLHYIFGNYSGFLEIRQVRQKGVAFIEYDSDASAAYAKREIQGRGMVSDMIGEQVKVNFAKK